MELTKAFLEEQYHALKKSTTLIAKECGVPKYAVTNAFAKFKIPYRSLKEATRPKGSLNLPGHKWCPGCKADLPHDNFTGGGKLGKLVTHCRPCRARLAKKYFAPQMERRRRFKAQVVRQLGDRCMRCKAAGLPLTCYQFHHRDPSVKERDMYHVITPSGIVCPEEISKCDLLCANCHHIIHHGTETVSDLLGPPVD